MKCSICKKTLGETFLKKVIGTVIKDSKGKKYTICSECQKKLGTKEKVLANLPS